MSYRAVLWVSAAVMALAANPALATGRQAVDYSITPLTASDVDFYLAILRAAALHNAHLVGDDRQAVALVEAMQKHPQTTPQNLTPAAIEQMKRNAKLMARAAELASYDDTIAREHNASQRYDAIKEEVEQVVTVLGGTGASCGGSDCGGQPTAAQITRGRQTEAALEADKPLIAPHRAEIVALRKEIGGFMFGGAN